MTLGVGEGSYDVVVMCGGFASGHIDPVGVLHGARRALRSPGGLFVNGMTEAYTKIAPELQGLDKLFFDMEKRGLWKVVLRKIQEVDKPGLFHVCRRL